MAGVLIPLAPRAVYDLSDMIADVSCEVTIARAIPLYSWATGLLQVSLYDNSLQGDARVIVGLQDCVPAEDDPFDDFVGGTVASIGIQFGTASKRVMLDQLTVPMPSFADLTVRLSNVTAATPGSVVFSADLLLRGRHFDRVTWDSDHAQPDS